MCANTWKNWWCVSPVVMQDVKSDAPLPTDYGKNSACDTDFFPSLSVAVRCVVCERTKGRNTMFKEEESTAISFFTENIRSVALVSVVCGRAPFHGTDRHDPSL